MTTKKQIDDGGPAFPRAASETDNPNMFHEPQCGMSLRDWFAARATKKDINHFIPDYDCAIRDLMVELGILPLHPKAGQSLNYTEQDMAKLRCWARYQHADLMLAARKGGEA